MRLPPIIVLSLVAVGCGHDYPLPMTAAELAAYDSGDALVAYLGQPDASPTVCDLRAQGPHLVDRRRRRAHARWCAGSATARSTPDLWRRCANALVRSSAPDDAAALARRRRPRLPHAHPAARDFEKRRRRCRSACARCSASTSSARTASTGTPPSTTRCSPSCAARSPRTGSARWPRAFGEELIATVDLEHGLWNGPAGRRCR